MTKSVLVTGGAHRLGALLCKTFAENGWMVWCHYQNSQAAAQALCKTLGESGYQAQAIGANLSEDPELRQMMKEISDQSGPLTCLINNASSFQPDQGDSVLRDTLEQQLCVNLIAPLTLSSLMAEFSSQEPSVGVRSIVHVLDQKVLNLNPDYFSYTISKLALERSVALQAQALAPDIRVNGVAPGLIFISGPQSQVNFEKSSRTNLLKQPINPVKVAEACIFLAENTAITGMTLAVDNGQHLVPVSRDVMFSSKDD